MVDKKRSLFTEDASNLWLFPVRCYALSYPYYTMNPHTHPELEIMYAVHGHCQIYYWDHHDKKQSMVLKEGEYIFLDCHIPHELNIKKNTACRILNLELGLIKGLNTFRVQAISDQSASLKSFLSHAPYCLKGTDSNGTICYIITEIQKQFFGDIDKKENYTAVNLLIGQLLLELSRQFKHSSINHKGSIYIRRALQYISENYQDTLSVKRIAQYANISVSHLHRQFREQVGCSLIDQINLLRIDKAKLLLETSSLPIIDIAITVGFNSRQHFTYVFKNLTGCSPSLYRKQHGNEQLLYQHNL